MAVLPSGRLLSLALAWFVEVYSEALKDDHGWTVLMWAALAGNLDICAAQLHFKIEVIVPGGHGLRLVH